MDTSMVPTGGVGATGAEPAPESACLFNWWMRSVTTPTDEILSATVTAEEAAEVAAVYAQR
jgi:hypothetical protein